jgi:ABC-type antimicrobial peptide transport system permease subunit
MRLSAVSEKRVEERDITKARAKTLCRFKYLKRASLKMALPPFKTTMPTVMSGALISTS